MITQYLQNLYDSDFLNIDHTCIRLRSFNKLPEWQEMLLPDGRTLYYKDVDIKVIDKAYRIRFFCTRKANEYGLKYDPLTKKVVLVSASPFEGCYLVEKGVYQRKLASDQVDTFHVEYEDLLHSKVTRYAISFNEFLALYNNNVVRFLASNQERNVPKALVIHYLIEHYHMNMQDAGIALTKLEKHEDILFEFIDFIETGDMNTDNPITVENYTAKMIKDATYLTPLGAYNYLIYLRNNPKEALKDLKAGLPRK